MLRYGERMREVSGCDIATTNNRMELQAAIGALEALKQSCEVDLYTDSQYLRQGVTEWLPMWKKRGWRTVDKKPVRNQDLWQRLDVLTAGHVIRWHWLKGHAGHRDNERCDALAQAEIEKLRKQFTRAQLKEAKAAFQSTVPGNVAR